jgi:hypothetical protein
MAFSFLNDLDMGDSNNNTLAAPQQQQQYYQPTAAPQQPLTSYMPNQVAYGSGSNSNSTNNNSNQPTPLELFLMETRKIIQSNYTQCARLELENKKQKEQYEKFEKRLQTILYILIALFIIIFILAILLSWTCYQASSFVKMSLKPSNLIHHHQPIGGLPGYTHSWTS